MDLNGQIIVPFEYENLSYCGGDYFVAKKNKYGLITKENKIVYDFKTDEIWFAAKEDVFAYRMNTTWYVVKREGNCTVCIIDCSSEDKAKGAGGVVILKAISEGLNKVDCDIIDEAFLLLHYYEYKW